MLAMRLAEPSAFSERNGVLHCEDASLQAIASSIATPFYVYSRRSVIERYRAVARAFSPMPHLISVAIKANSLPALLRLLHQEGAGAEVVSGAELALALRVGFPPERVVFSGVGKNETELRAAIEAGILLVNAESAGELEWLERLAAASDRRVRVGIRINPAVEPRTHPHMSTGQEKAKFGVDLDTARVLFARRAELPHLSFCGLHAHIGSQITSLEPLSESARLLGKLAAELRASGVHLTELDIGGGLGIAYGDEPAPNFEAYAGAVLPWLSRAGARVILELGRSLLAQSGALVVRILYVKQVHGRRFVVVDAGMNDLLRPALYGAYHRIVAVNPRPGASQTWDVAGAVCESSDFFGRDRPLVDPQPGDLLAILDAGAYGFSMGSNYNLRPRPCELLVDGADFRVVRPAETVEQLVERELPGGS
jgi:diaminopimelate decarboxylase